MTRLNLIMRQSEQMKKHRIERKSILDQKGSTVNEILIIVLKYEGIVKTYLFDLAIFDINFINCFMFALIFHS